MSDSASFGKDIGLVHEAIVTGRKAGWGQEEWAKLAHDEALMRSLLPVIHGRGVVQASSRLQPRGTTTLPANDNRYDPKSFKRAGRYVWDGFNDRILAVAKPIRRVPGITVESSLFTESLAVTDICAELGDDRIFENVSVFVAQLDALLERQKSGEEVSNGLLVNGYANIFYVRGINSEVFAVRAVWGFGRREWRVDADQLDDYRRRAGYCEFRTTDA